MVGIVLVDLKILRYLFFAPSILYVRERNAILDVLVDLKILRYVFFAACILHARERNAILDVFVDLKFSDTYSLRLLSFMHVKGTSYLLPL